MRILYIGALQARGYGAGGFIGSTSYYRMKAMESLGHTIEPIDVRAAMAGPTLVDRALDRMRGLRAPAALKRQVLAAAASQMFDIAWFDKGIWFDRRLLRAIRSRCPGVKLVNYNPDDPFGHGVKWPWRGYFGAIPEYDVVLAPRAENVDEYRRAGARRVEHIVPFWGYSPDLHYPEKVTDDERQRYGGKVGFIGYHQPERAASIEHLCRAGVPVRIWSPDWAQKAAGNQPNLRIEPTGLFADDYRKALCAFDIVLGFLHKGHRDQHTSRSVEVPACGAFMLAEHSGEHGRLFEEDKEVVLFKNDQELVTKVSYYLNHPQERREIAEASYRRCIDSDYSNRGVVQRMLAQVDA